MTAQPREKETTNMRRAKTNQNDKYENITKLNQPGKYCREQPLCTQFVLKSKLCVLRNKFI